MVLFKYDTFLRLKLIFASTLLICNVAFSQLAFEPVVPQPPNFEESPVPLFHYSPARQASTFLKGPKTNNCEVQVLELESSFGKNFGPSPWHVVSSKRYSEDNALTIWGTSLTDTYRIKLQGDKFEALDYFEVNKFPTSITWNLFSMDDGRVIVPDASGFMSGNRKDRSLNPSWLILSDNNKVGANSEIKLLDKFEFKPSDLQDFIKPPAGSKLARLTAGNSSVPMYSKEIATVIAYKKDKKRYSYLLIINLEEKKLVASELVGEGLLSNAMAAEPFGNDGTAIYVPLEESMVKMVWSASKKKVEQHWSVKLPVRRRTGTTPTLVNTSDGKQFVVVIDSECAVASVTNALIACSEEERPSQLVAVERSTPKDQRPFILTTDLPSWLRTVENSPSAAGDRIIVANYSGYLPNGLMVPAGGEIKETETPRWLVSKDAIEDFAKGLVALKYDKGKKNFVIDWENDDIQINGITAISTGSNMVYGSGAEEENGKSWLYGFQLTDSDSGNKGDLKLRVELGAAPFRGSKRDRKGNLIIPRKQYQLTKNEIFDMGNQILILEDGSIIVSGGRAIVRVRERK